MVSPATPLMTWSLSKTTSPKKSTNPQIWPAGDINNIQLEVMHSKQTRHTFNTSQSCHRVTSSSQYSPGREEVKLTLKKKYPFWLVTKTTPTLSLQGTCPWGLHLPAGSKSGPAALVPCHWAHFTNKGASSASWLHEMDTCPLSIGPEIGDFHKGQPTAGRQAPPGHCHPGLNRRQRLCLYHGIPPSVFYFQLLVCPYGKAM